MKLSAWVSLAGLMFARTAWAAPAALSATPASDQRGLTQVVVSDDALTSGVDGVYGRLDGDFSVAFGLGARVGELGPPLPNLQGVLYYYWTLGLYLKYADRFSAAEGREPRRVLGAGIELRPAFLLRWSNDLEKGPAFWDLMLDSLHACIGLGRVELERGPASIGAELGLGFGVPMLRQAQGLWLEGRATLFFAPDTRAAPAAWLMLAWHTSFISPWVED